MEIQVMLTCVKEGIYTLIPCLPTTLNEPKRYEQFTLIFFITPLRRYSPVGGRDGSEGKDS